MLPPASILSAIKNNKAKVNNKFPMTGIKPISFHPTGTYND
jgi:hypothetical protein